MRNIRYYAALPTPDGTPIIHKCGGRFVGRRERRARDAGIMSEPVPEAVVPEAVAPEAVVPEAVEAASEREGEGEGTKTPPSNPTPPEGEGPGPAADDGDAATTSAAAAPIEREEDAPKPEAATPAPAEEEKEALEEEEEGSDAIPARDATRADEADAEATTESTAPPPAPAPEPAPEPALEPAAPSADDGSTASAESPRGAESARIERTGSITAEESASRAKFLGPLSQFARLWCWFVPRIVLTPPTVDDSYALAAAARRVCCPRVQQRGEQGRVGPTPRGLRA